MKRELRLPADARGRLDRAVADALGVGRAAVKRAFAAGNVRVAGRRALGRDRAEPGAAVAIELETGPGAVAPNPGIALHVLAQGPAWLVVDKPSGVATHPLREGETDTLANAVVARHPECAEASPDGRDGGSLQRLDMETSGCVLFARSRPAWQQLREQLASRTVEKRYLALVAGRVSSRGVCSVPLAQRGGRVVAVPDPERPPKSTAHPREAETHFEIRQPFAERTLVEVRIVTGVMHQIRAHLAYLGHPVVGDRLYGGGAEALEGLDRLFLHASVLGFERPEGGRVRVESPLPPELERALARLS
jgi:23S rRNA pseudouridine1911/1915/1917 synthase